MNTEANFHFLNGASLKLDEQFSEAITEFETAINLGLSQEDEMKARFFLGESYACTINPNRKTEQIIKSHEFNYALTQMEKAVQMDAAKGYQFFKEHRSMLARLGFFYPVIGGFIQETQGDDAAINYYVQKLNLFSYLPTQPLLAVLLQLGVIYGNREDEENALRCYNAIRNAEPVMPEHESEIQVRQLAEDNLSRRKPETSAKTGCFIATAVYGEAAPELHFFRLFRDEFLLRSTAGRGFVSFYYLSSPRIAKLLAKSEYAKRFVKVILLKPFLYLIKSGTKETKSMPKNY